MALPQKCSRKVPPQIIIFFYKKHSSVYSEMENKTPLTIKYDPLDIFN